MACATSGRDALQRMTGALIRRRPQETALRNAMTMLGGRVAHAPEVPHGLEPTGQYRAMGTLEIHARLRLAHMQPTALQFADVFDQINALASGTPTNVINP